MEMDVREFLKQFSPDELVDREILRGNTRLLKSGSETPLMALMLERDVSRLRAQDREWSLTSEGEFQNPRSTEAESGRVEDLGNPGNVFNLQNTSINPHYINVGSHTGPELDPGEEDSRESRFGFEQALQQALRDNIHQLEPGLKITDGGVEQTVEGRRRIDIAAEDANGCQVIIELKRGRAPLRAIAQLLSYMGSANHDPGRPIRGILVANDFDPSLVLAAKAVDNVSLKAYSVHFSFSER